MQPSVISKIRSAPKDPGVYIFYRGGKVLYVGKAANLRARLKSYLKITDIKTQSLNEEAGRLEYIVLRSDIEALIEESRLIKELKPKYNIVFRDDKSYSYVYFTKENFPKVFIGHRNPKPKNSNLKTSAIGPFTDSGALRLVMKLLRRQFPYCACFRPHLRDCLNAQIGRCVGICCKKSTAESNSGYKKVIRKIKMVLRGQSKKLLASLKDEKERAALNNILQHQPYVAANFVDGGHAISSERLGGDSARSVRSLSETNGESPRAKRLVPLEHKDAVSEKWLTAGARVECYDNSNFAGKEAVGAMTALVKTAAGWQSDKNSYRKFIIKSAPTRDDPRMMGEVVSRRLNHPEWPYPDLIIIDGGLTQFRAAKTAAGKYPAAGNVKIISFAKPHKLIYGLRENDAPTPLLTLPKEFQELLDRAIYQTHNFVIRFHREKRGKEFIPKN